jgi:hypothetical protein
MFDNGMALSIMQEEKVAALRQPSMKPALRDCDPFGVPRRVPGLPSLLQDRARPPAHLRRPGRVPLHGALTRAACSAAAARPRYPVAITLALGTASI